MQEGFERDRQDDQQDDSLIGRDERNQQRQQQPGQEIGQDDQDDPESRQNEFAEADDEEIQGDYGSAGESAGGLSGETSLDDQSSDDDRGFNRDR